MKETIRKILKEQNEGIKERFFKNMRSLEYVIQSKVNGDIIEDIEFDNVEFYEKYSEIVATVKVKSWCEDPDLNELAQQLKKVEKEIYSSIRNLEFSKNGKLNTVNDDTYLMLFAVKVNWDSGSGDLFIEFIIRQEDYRD
jgi:hypothetical protein